MRVYLLANSRIHLCGNSPVARVCICGVMSEISKVISEGRSGRYEKEKERAASFNVCSVERDGTTVEKEG